MEGFCFLTLKTDISEWCIYGSLKPLKAISVESPNGSVVWLLVPSLKYGPQCDIYSPMLQSNEREMARLERQSLYLRWWIFGNRYMPSTKLTNLRICEQRKICFYIHLSDNKWNVMSKCISHEYKVKFQYHPCPRNYSENTEWATKDKDTFKTLCSRCECHRFFWMLNQDRTYLLN